MKRKELLEHVLKEMEDLRALEAREKRGAAAAARRGGGGGDGRDLDAGERRKRGRWALF